MTGFGEHLLECTHGPGNLGPGVQPPWLPHSCVSLALRRTTHRRESPSNLLTDMFLPAARAARAGSARRGSGARMSEWAPAAAYCNMILLTQILIVTEFVKGNCHSDTLRAVVAQGIDSHSPVPVSHALAA